MTLEEINKQYQLNKQLIDQLKKDKERLDKDYKDALKEKNDAETEIANAEKAKDQKAKQEAEKKLKDAIDKIQYITMQIETCEKSIENSQNAIKGYVEQLRNDPEIMEQCSQAFEKNRQRQQEKWEKRRDERLEAKENWEKLKEEIEKRPNAVIEIDKITAKTYEIRQIKEEIKAMEEEKSQLDPADPDFTTKKRSLQAKINTKNRQKRAKEDERNKSKAALKNMLNGKYSDCIEQLEERTDLDRNIQNYERLAERANRKVEEYKNRENTLTPSEPEPEPEPEKKSVFTRIKGFFSNIFKKKAPELPEPEPDPEPEPELITKKENALQYLIVRDLTGVEEKRFQGRTEGKKGTQVLEGNAMKPKEDDDFIK